MIKVSLKPNGATVPIEVRLERAGDAHRETLLFQAGRVHKELEVEWLVPGRGWLSSHGRVIPFCVVRNDTHISVWLDGRTHNLELVDRTPRRAATAGTAPDSGRLVAPMPGTILKIDVAVGSAFEAHQPLIIMESMKMEMTLSVPHPGRVVEITCQPGQLVEMGAMLARVEQADEPPNAS